VKREIRFAADAVVDLDGIAAFTGEQFGLAQETRYRDDLRRVMELLLTFPMMGAGQDHIATGLRRHVHASHAIYYSEHPFGILIERILGPGMDPAREFGG
jgi:toxin ParE1/3/4